MPHPIAAPTLARPIVPGAAESAERRLIRGVCRVPVTTAAWNEAAWRGVPMMPAPQRASDWSFGDAPTPPTRVRAIAGRDELAVRFECDYDTPANLAPRSPSQPLEEGEHAWLELYPRNDPTDQFRFTADYKGLRQAHRRRRMTGECSLERVHDRWQGPAQSLTAEWRLLHGVEARTWWTEFLIPWRTLGVDAMPCTIGIAYGRAVSTRPRSAWLAGVSWPRVAPDETAPPIMVDHAVAAIGRRAIAPGSIAFEPLRFGRNRGRLMFPADTDAASKVRVTTLDADGRPVSSTISGAIGDAEFEFDLERGLSSYTEPFRVPGIQIECLSAEDEPLFVQRLPMDRHFGLTVDEPYGAPAAADRVAPIPRERALRRVIEQLPRLRRATTAQGAPSDFCLLHDDGRVAVDLMRDDAWPRLAAIVTSEFPERDDRLLAAMCFVGQKSVTNYILAPMFHTAEGKPSYHSMHHELMGPLSIVRYGGGPAVARAAVLARLLEHIDDPATGRPFVARVVPLDRDGGPKPPRRSFLDSRQVTGFIPFPGPIGAVAVERSTADGATSFTLLDPTALTAFVRGDGALATLEEITSDAALRSEGAGRLADVYARIDAEEVQRIPANTPLSRGVFPELAADEDGNDAPAGERQHYAPRVVVAPAERWSPWLEGFTLADGTRGVRDGSARVRVDASGIQFEAVVRSGDAAAWTPSDRDAERFHVALDLEHAHRAFVHAEVNLAGRVSLSLERSTQTQSLFKRLTTENQLVLRKLDSARCHATVTPRADGYAVALTLPWAALETERYELPPVIGWSAWLDGRRPRYEQVHLCPPRYRLTDPFSFADVYLRESPLTVEAIEPRDLHWGDNQLEVRLRNRSPHAVRFTASTTTRLCMRRHEHVAAPVHGEIGAGEEAIVNVPLFLDPEEKFTSGDGQQIALTIRCDGDDVFRGRWHAGYAHGLYPHDRYGSQLGPRSDPSPGDPHYLRRKIEFIASRLPLFERLGTRRGAPSDFFLRAEDGSAEFNLMEPGVMDRMAAYVAGRFDNDLDRVLGVWLFALAPWVARHQSAGHRFMNGVGPLSVMRGFFAGGGGNCGFHSRVFAGLAARLPLSTGTPVSHSLPVWGHVATLIAWGDGRAILDGDVGHVFLTPDGRGLATMDHLRRSLDVLTTAGPGEFGRYLSFDDARAALLPALTYDAAGSFPPGAPRS